MIQKAQFILSLILSIAFSHGVAAQEQDADYQVQGEYTGKLAVDGDEFKYGIQVIALGKGKFTGVGFMDGLPGDGWNRESPERVEDVAIVDGVLKLANKDAEVLILDGIATVKSLDGAVIGQLNRIVRKSPTLGQKAPDGAEVLFDGSSVDQWSWKGKPGKMTEDGLLTQGTASKKKFQDHQIHIEFLLPYKPDARGQGRGNSGIYMQGRYEVQMLDSFGLSGEHNECGGIYSIAKPSQNMCFPPLQWQTYDIEFHAAKFDGKTKTANASMTVKHNGVVIHDKVDLPKSTTASPLKEGPEAGFIFLQDHGNPVRYRNIWVKTIEDEN